MSLVRNIPLSSTSSRKINRWPRLDVDMAEIRGDKHGDDLLAIVDTDSDEASFRWRPSQGIQHLALHLIDISSQAICVLQIRRHIQRRGRPKRLRARRDKEAGAKKCRHDQDNGNDDSQGESGFLTAPRHAPDYLFLRPNINRKL